MGILLFDDERPEGAGGLGRGIGSVIEMGSDVGRREVVNESGTGSDGALGDAGGAVRMRRPLLRDAVKMDGDAAGGRKSIDDVDDDAIETANAKLRTRHLTVEDDGFSPDAVGRDAVARRAVEVVLDEALPPARTAFGAHGPVQRSRQNEDAGLGVGAAAVAIAFVRRCGPSPRRCIPFVGTQI